MDLRGRWRLGFMFVRLGMEESKCLASSLVHGLEASMSIERSTELGGIEHSFSISVESLSMGTCRKDVVIIWGHESWLVSGRTPISLTM